MKPRPREPHEYEKVRTDDFVTGKIEDVQYQEDHSFGKWPNDSGEVVEKKGFAIRFKFIVDGYEYSKYSRWMYFTYGEKSNLYNKYLLPLVEGAKPDMDFDLDQLKDMPIKMLWTEKNNYQSVETIRPLTGKIKPIQNETQPASDIVEPVAEIVEPDEPVPF